MEKYFQFGKWLCFIFLALAAPSTTSIVSPSRSVTNSNHMSRAAASQSTPAISSSVSQLSRSSQAVLASSSISVSASESTSIRITPTSIAVANITAQNYTVENTTDSPKDDKTKSSLWQTVGIAVGVSSSYLVLVAGLSFLVERRKSRRLSNTKPVRKIIGSQGCGNVNAAFTGDVEKHDIEGNNMVMKEKNGILSSQTSYDNLKFPRHDLETLRILGNGAYGRAYLAQAIGIRDSEYKTLVVVKSLLSDKEQVREEFNNELNALRGLQHKNVVSLLGVCKEVEPIYLIFESLEKGDLKQLLLASQSKGQPTLELNQQLAICAQVASGMKYLSSQNFIHKDLSARNCLVGEDLHVKISFLRLSSDVYSDDYYSLDNVPKPLRWMPPEAIFDNNFSEKSDVWSYGVLVWEIFTSGQTPYKDLSNEEVLKCARYGLRPQDPDNCPGSLIKALQKCWEGKPSERPTFSELFDTFSSCGVNTRL